MNRYYKQIELSDMCGKQIRGAADDVGKFRILGDDENAGCSMAYAYFWMELHKIILKDLCDYISGPRLRAYRDAAAETAKYKVREKYHSYVDLGRTMFDSALENCK